MQAEFADAEIRLISDALSVLQENRYSELKWANGDPYIINVNRSEIDEIDRLLEKLNDAPADNRDRVGVPESHVVTFCDSDGKPVVSYEDGFECPYCHATGVRHYCPDCGAKMFYTE